MKKLVSIPLLCVAVIGGALAYHKFLATPRNSETHPVSKQSEEGAIQTVQPTNTTPSPILPAGPPHASTISGIIEGFYGQPWTQAQRISMLQFMAHNHLNTYVYAPKDDPYQRASWNMLYPAAQVRQIETLVQAGQQDGIEFVYSISPGIPAPLPGQTLAPDMVAKSIAYTSISDRAKLENKIDQLRACGVRTFMLSFDDVEKTLKPVDQHVYGSDYARAHIDLANEVLNDEKQKDSGFRLWLAPTTYYGLADNHYWQTIRTRLNPAIQVIWTGKWVLNESITGSQAMQVARLIGRKPLLWDNYPVNDYTYVVKKTPALMMGPLEHRSADLPDHLAGYLANPMLQPEASKIPLTTLGQYLSSPHSYNPATAWQYAMQHTVGVSDPSAWLKFCQYVSKSTLNGGGYSPFRALASAFWRSHGETSRSQSENALRRELQTLQNLPNQLHSTVTNQPLQSEIDPWLTKLGEEGETGQLALTYLDMSPSNGARPAKRQEVMVHLQALQSNPLQVGDEVIAFIQQAVAK